ncbi:hypothetical protein CYY_001778 [Polysphondylium violaceum]|uniref:Condensin complex subunit 1 n=1 Tax=Polysphondylium violaceum TaxID=133409 RepID=A0A8J4Q0J9_9MYCE|nr:hypothetical protein CYY_001778 [Polysphondylium violaceum]
MTEFIIPKHFGDLLVPSSSLGNDQQQQHADRYVPENVIDIGSLSENIILANLDTISDSIKRNATNIIKHDNFDKLYCFSNEIESLNVDHRNQILKILYQGLVSITNVIFRTLQKSADEEDLEYLSCLKNCLKIYIFLLEHYILYQQDPKSQSSTSAAAVVNATSAATKKRKKTTKDSGSADAWASENEKDKILDALYEVLKVLNLAELWRLKAPEEDFINLFANVCYSMFKDHTHNLKSKSIKNKLYSILLILLDKYDHEAVFTDNMVGLLINHEPLVPYIADLYKHFVDIDQQQGQDQSFKKKVQMDDDDEDQDKKIEKTKNHMYLVTSILRTIYKHREGSKTLSMFLSELAKRIPKSILSQLGHLTCHLSGESYLMRNGVIEAIGYLIEQAFNTDANSSNIDDGGKKESGKDDLIGILFDRMMDVNGFSRSNVIQTFTYLIKSDSLPKKYFQPLTDAAIERLLDKTSIVRKNTIKLLAKMIRHNIYRVSSLNLDFMRQQKTKLNQLIEKGKESLPDESKQNDDDDEEEQDQDNDQDREQNKYRKLKIDKEELLELCKQTGITIRPNIPVTKILVQFSKYLASLIGFLESIDGCFNTIVDIMVSTNTSEVVQAVKFIKKAFMFRVYRSEYAISRMLSLVWNKEDSIKKTSIEAFSQILLTTRPDIAPPKSYFYISKNLLNMTKDKTLGEITSLEELINNFNSQDLISSQVIKALWEIFSGSVVGHTPEDERGALMILSMIASSNPAMLKSKLNLILSHGLDSKSDPYLPRVTCIILQKFRNQAISPAPSATTAKDKDKDLAKEIVQEIAPRFSNRHPILEKLKENILIDKVESHEQWLMFAEQAINTIYVLSDQPDTLCDKIIQKMSSQFTNFTNVDNKQLARFIFLIGHVALKQLLHIEIIQSEIKKSLEEKDKSDKASSKKSKKKKEQDSLEKDLGLDLAQAEHEAEARLNSAESDITDTSCLIGKFSPLIIHICKNQMLFNDKSLQLCSTLTLAKLMCINSQFCDENLRLLMTLLENSQHQDIRSNIIICLGDLAFRFPNTLEPWTPNIYSRLKDPDIKTRKNSLNVLSHLILNDMIKAKTQISDMAICLEDEHPEISNIARVFFHTYSTKEKRLENSLTDIIGRISQGAITREKAQNIMKYLFSFFEKDSSIDSIVDKLFNRLKDSSTSGSKSENHLLFYFLQLLKHTDKTLKKVNERMNTGQFKHLLLDIEIFNHMMSIVSKTKKSLVNSTKGDTKKLVEDLEKFLLVFKAESSGEMYKTNENGTDTNINDIAPPPKPTTKRGKKPAAPPTSSSKKAPASRKKKIVSSSEEESSEESDQEQSSSEESNNDSGDDQDDDGDDNKMQVDSPPPPSKTRTRKPPPAKPAKPPAKKATKKAAASRKKIVSSEEEESSDESESASEESSENSD